MRHHLLTIHNIDVEKDGSEKAPKQMKTSMMATVDGFSIRKITQSELIRKSLSLRGMRLPADESSVVSLVQRFM